MKQFWKSLGAVLITAIVVLGLVNLGMYAIDRQAEISRMEIEAHAATTRYAWDTAYPIRAGAADCDCSSPESKKVSTLGDLTVPTGIWVHDAQNNMVHFYISPAQAEKKIETDIEPVPDPAAWLE